MSYKDSPVTIMSQQDVPFQPEIYAGQASIALHDQEGFPYELSFEMLKERGFTVCILGCLLEAVARKWDRRATRNMLLGLFEIYPPREKVRAWAERNI